MNNLDKRGLEPLSAEDLALLHGYVASQGLPEQVVAIECAAPLTVVSAGAGTGKTWTLAWRFVWTVLTREDARRMLTLTFTEKAAAEMKSRIASLLVSLEPVLRNSPELSRRRAAALKWLDQAYISTIHSFGRRVIGEAGLSLPVEPSLRVIGGAEKAEFWNEAAAAIDRLDAEWFARGMDASYAEAARALLADEAFAGVVNHWRPEILANFAGDFENAMGDFGYTAESVLRCADAPDEKVLERVRAHIMKRYRELAEMWRDAIDVDPMEFGGKGTFASRFLDFRSRWLGKDFSSEENSRAFVEDAAETVKGAKSKTSLYDAIAECLGMKLSEWRDIKKELIPFTRLLDEGWSEDEIRLRKILLRFAWLCWRKWQSFKDSRGCITFGDMISLAGEALEGDPRYASRFSEVLVDEFQDTNSRQDRLLRVIRRAAGARLFIVGDLKQSIYRFRNAEPSLFERYISEAKNGGGRYVSLSVSFRSGEAVLDAVNRRFSGIWERRLGEDLNVPYEPLNSPRGVARAASWIDERQNTTLPVCESIMEENSGGTAEARGKVALRLAVRLSQLHADGAKVWGHDGLRPVRWGDMAVLVPTRNSYESLRRAFSMTSIPASFIGAKNYYKRMEVRDVCSLAAFLANPGDRTALAGFLCSPFSGLTQDEAQSLVPRLGSEPLGVLRAAHPKIAERLEGLCRTARLDGPSAAIASLLARGDLLSQIHPRKRAGAFANLRRAVSLLKDYEDSVAWSPVGASAYLQKALRGGESDLEAAAESGDDAVSVMTIHASKGLEFPLVVMFGMEHNANGGEKSAPVPSRTLLAAASEFPANWQLEEAECDLKRVHSLLEKQAELEERQRLYYVALTRARDGVILCGLLPKGGAASAKAGSYLELEARTAPLSPAADERYLAEVGKFRRLNAPRFEKSDSSGVSVPMRTDRPRALRGVSATSWALWSMCPAAWRMAFRQNLDLTWNADADESFGDSAGGAGLGSVAHWLLSKWDFTAEGAARLLGLQDGHLRPEFRRVWRDPAARIELRNFIDRFGTPEGEQLIARLRAAHRAGTLEREAPFCAKLGAVDLVGFVDVFWIEKDPSGRPARLCVRDYKTTRIPSDPLRGGWMTEMYSQQLRFYALALRTVHPEYASLEMDLAFWNLRRGEAQKLVPPKPGDDESFCESLANMARAAAAGPWPPNLERCAGCAYARGCIYRTAATA